jgi:riboflavin biosynthesis pyrimidine reductase
MVTSVDGAVTVDGRARGLSGDADRRLFGLLRGLADVILVGAGTARIEGYGPATPRPEYAQARSFAGQPPAPRIAVVSGSADLDPETQLFTDARPRTLVFTTAAADATHRSRLSEVAEVHVAGDQQVDLERVVATLVELGLARILCEGGPHLLGTMAALGLVDEFAVSYSPTVAGGDSGRIVAGPAMAPTPLDLVGLIESDDFLFARYVRRDRHDAPAAPLTAPVMGSPA